MIAKNRIKTIANDLFFEQVKDWLKQGKNVKIPVVGNSMLPALKNGDTVLLEPIGRVKLGDVVLATYNDGFILHRVVGRCLQGLQLVGDGNIGQLEKVKDSDVWGRVVRVYRTDIEIERTDWKWRTFGMCWYILRPLRAIVVRFKNNS